MPKDMACHGLFAVAGPRSLFEVWGALEAIFDLQADVLWIWAAGMDLSLAIGAQGSRSGLSFMLTDLHAHRINGTSILGFQSTRRPQEQGYGKSVRVRLEPCKNAHNGDRQLQSLWERNYAPFWNDLRSNLGTQKMPCA